MLGGAQGVNVQLAQASACLRCLNGVFCCLQAQSTFPSHLEIFCGADLRMQD